MLWAHVHLWSDSDHPYRRMAPDRMTLSADQCTGSFIVTVRCIIE